MALLCLSSIWFSSTADSFPSCLFTDYLLYEYEKFPDLWLALNFGTVNDYNIQYALENFGNFFIFII